MRRFNLLLLGIFISCQSRSNQAQKQSVQILGEKQEITMPALAYDTVNGAIGIIVPSETYQFGEAINIYTQEHKLIRQITRTDENQIIALMCVAQDEQYYQVKFEDEVTGFIQRNSKQVVFQTWEEHVLDVFSVDFDIKDNPLRKDPSEGASTLDFDQDEFYHPNQIKGEWLQVKWGSEGNWNYGWIKWKEKNKLLIDLYYFA